MVDAGIHVPVSGLGHDARPAFPASSLAALPWLVHCNALRRAASAPDLLEFAPDKSDYGVIPFHEEAMEAMELSERNSDTANGWERECKESFGLPSRAKIGLSRKANLAQRPPSPP